MKEKFKIHVKIYFIRWQARLNRREFCEIVDIPSGTLESIENKGTDPRTSYVKNICKAFPEYTLWLMLDEVDLDSGQISPMIRFYWHQRLPGVRQGLDGNMDDVEKFFELAQFDRKNKIHIEELKKIIDYYFNGDTDLEYPFHSSVFHGTNINFD